jgi:hypothetical protein
MRVELAVIGPPGDGSIWNVWPAPFARVFTFAPFSVCPNVSGDQSGPAMQSSLRRCWG